MMKISKNLYALAELFSKANADLFIVGGAVRNYLLNLPYQDIDICSKLSIDEAIELLSNTKYLIKIKNALTQTAQIICENEVYEYARFRKEEYDEFGARIPNKITFVDNAEDDYLRRDFTCNSIYYDIINRKIVDFVGGQRDIQAKVLNTTLSPEQTLLFDALRLLRLIRFSLYYSLTPTKEVLEQAKKNSHLLLHIKGQSKKEELVKILQFGTENKKPYEYNYKKLHYLLSLNYLPYLFSSKLKKIQFDSNIKEIFPLSLNCNNKDLALTCFIVDLYSYILSKQIFIDKEIIELILGQDGLQLNNKEIAYFTKLCSAYTYANIEKQPRFYIYLNNEIINDIINLFNFNNDINNLIKTLTNELKLIKHKKLPLNLSDLPISGKDIHQLSLKQNSSVNYVLKRIHYAVLFEQVKNNKQDIMQFINKNFA